MTITFGVLGWSWYELSGGSSFVAGDNTVAFLAPPVEYTPAASQTSERVARVSTRSTPDYEPQVTRTTGMGAGLASVANLRTSNPIVLDMGSGAVQQDDTSVELIVAALQQDASEAAAMEPSTDAVGSINAVSSIDYRWVTGSVVNLRSGPGTNHDVVVQLFEGEEVEVMQDDGTGWVKLRAMAGNNEIGWMSGNFLSARN